MKQQRLRGGTEPHCCACPPSQDFARDAHPGVFAAPNPDNILEWHYVFVITNDPSSLFYGGVYYGRETPLTLRPCCSLRHPVPRPGVSTAYLLTPSPSQSFVSRMSTPTSRPACGW